MSDKKIVEYIKENLSKGLSLKSIKKHLIVHGHKEKDVKEAISEVNKDYEKGKV